MDVVRDGFGTLSEIGQDLPDGVIDVLDATPTAFSNPVLLPDGYLSRVDYLIECDDGAGNFYVYAAQVWAKRAGAVVTILKTIELGDPPIADEITVGGMAFTDDGAGSLVDTFTGKIGTHITGTRTAWLNKRRAA